MAETTHAAVPRWKGWLTLAFWVVLLLYVGIHACLRIALYPHLELDEAEEVVLGQHLAWGYYGQGPAYPWLVWLSFQVFGVGIPALAVVKLFVLAAIYGSLYLCAREVLPGQRGAVLAAFSLWLVPALAWDALVDGAHSPLLCAVCLATFLVVLRIHRYGLARDYVLLGLAVALGVVTKYNYFIFVGALVLAGLSVASVRRRLFDWRMVLALSVGFVAVLPHLVWALEQREMLAGFLAKRTGVGQATSRLASIATGTASLGYNVFLATTPLWVFLVGFFPEGLRWQREPTDVERLLGRFFVAALALLGLQILVGGSTYIMARWLVPFVVLLPLYYFLRVGSTVPWRRQAAFAAVLGCCVLIGVGVRISRARHEGLAKAQDAAALAHVRELHERSGIKLLVVHDHLTAGHLKIHFPHLSVVCMEFPLAAPELPPDPDKPWLVVWRARADECLPPSLRAFLAQYCKVELPPRLHTPVVGVGRGFAAKESERVAFLPLSRAAAALDDSRR